PDPSVSTTHAKLQRREGVWVIVDLESTNGTFVDGERVKGESPLAPGALLRFGDVQLVFEPSDDALGMTKGGGTQVMKDVSAVADGMGGHAAGEVASEMAVRFVARELGSLRGLSDDQVADRMRTAIRAANGAIFQRTLTEHDKRGMGTTVTALVLYHTRFLVG